VQVQTGHKRKLKTCAQLYDWKWPWFKGSSGIWRCVIWQTATKVTAESAEEIKLYDERLRATKRHNHVFVTDW